jgi:hypothetical protein
VLLLQRHCLPDIGETDAVLEKCVQILQLYQSSSRTALRCLRLLELSLKTFPSRTVVAKQAWNNGIGGNDIALRQHQATSRNSPTDPSTMTAPQVPTLCNPVSNTVEDLILHSQSFQSGLRESYMPGSTYFGSLQSLNESSIGFDEELLDLDLAWLNTAPFDVMSPDLCQDYSSALAFA